MSHLSVYMLISQLVILGSALLSRNLVHVENHRTYITKVDWPVIMTLLVAYAVSVHQIEHRS